ARWLAPGRTAAFVGSSGVGKSSLINRLLGAEVLATGAVRASDDRGRHVTTRRELHPLASGALVIDTPGMRLFGLLQEEESLAGAFPDTDALAAPCRFADCAQAEEPECAVRAAVAPDRLAAWRKLRRELAFYADRHDPEARAAQRKKMQVLTKQYRLRDRL